MRLIGGARSEQMNSMTDDDARIFGRYFSTPPGY